LVKIHLRANLEGLPVTVTLSPGEAHDVTTYDNLMALHEADPAILLADRGYDSDAIRQDLLDRGAEPEIPTSATALSNTGLTGHSMRYVPASNAS
jgi:IS5 family transposase